MGIAVGHSWIELYLLRGLRTCVHVWHIKKHKLCFTDDTLRAHVPICSVQECVEFMHSLACQLNVSYTCTCILHIYMLVHVQCVHVLSMA